MEGFENGGDVSGFRSLNNSTNKKVLNLLEPVKLTVWEVMIERESYSSQVESEKISSHPRRDLL